MLIYIYIISYNFFVISLHLNNTPITSTPIIPLTISKPLPNPIPILNMKLGNAIIVVPIIVFVIVIIAVVSVVLFFSFIWRSCPSPIRISKVGVLTYNLLLLGLCLQIC